MFEQTIATEIKKLIHGKLQKSGSPGLDQIMEWTTPVIAFGDIENSQIATVGINPSNLEFEDRWGKELVSENRRFHTLNSLRITDWGQLNDNHVSLIAASYKTYFMRNPYDSWFKQLDYMIERAGFSYYSPQCNACHLDLVPHATWEKWSKLTSSQKSSLLDSFKNPLANLINSSPIKVLILNGSTVIKAISQITECVFEETDMPAWNLARKAGSPVRGRAFYAKISKIGSVNLHRTLKVIGFNHNIQSSYGVTKRTRANIRDWVHQFIQGL